MKLSTPCGVNDVGNVESSNRDSPIAMLCKRHEGKTYLFCVNTRQTPTTARFTLSDSKVGATVEVIEVIDEGRTLRVGAAGFEDAFEGYAVHLYRVGA